MKQIVLLSKFIVLGIFDNLCSSSISDAACYDHITFSGIVNEIYVNKSTFKVNNFNLRTIAQSV